MDFTSFALWIIYFCALLYFTANVGFLVVVSLAAFVKGRSLTPASSSQSGFFTLLIPAHNEESSISRTVESLQNLDYPQDKFRIIVIADNCSDNTARVASSHDCEVWERYHETQKSKGYALEFAIERLEGEPIPPDAVVIIDADSTVDPQFLRHFNDSLQNGSRWLQAYYTVINADASWQTRLMTYAFSLFNGVIPMGLNSLNKSSPLRGNGMCFTWAGLKDIPWTAYGLTEDLEFGWLLRLRQQRVDFVKQAVVYGEMVTSSGDAASGQRQRWEIGRAALRKQFTRRLLSEKELSLSSKVAYLIDLYMLPLVPLVASFLAFMGGSIILSWFLSSELVDFATWLNWYLLAGLIAYSLSPFVIMQLPTSYLSIFVDIPKYALWKLQVFKKEKPQGWVRTPRESARDERKNPPAS